MRIIIAIVLLLAGFVAGAQKGWFWVNLNKSPKLVKIHSTNTQSGTGSRTHSLTGVPGGALLVVTTQNEDETGTATLSSSPSLTWTKTVDAPLVTHTGRAQIWTATFTNGGSITITSNFGAHNQSSVAWVITGQETSLGGATATSSNDVLPSKAITTTRANSILICVSSDWNAVSGSLRGYLDTATEAYYYFSSGHTTGYHYYKQATSIASYTEGMTAPTGQAANTLILEVRGP